MFFLKTVLFALFLIHLALTLAFAQERRQGPLIQGYGETYVPEKLDISPSLEMEYRLLLEIDRETEDKSTINSSFNTAARFLNMHVAIGVPKEKLHVVLVVHGTAGFDVLNDAAYHSRYGINNPNIPLLQDLFDHGVQVVLCSQTAAHRGINKSDIVPKVSMALSAMTALVEFQEKGYRLVPF